MGSEHHTAFAPRRSAVQERLAPNAQASRQVLGCTRDEQLHLSPWQYDLAYGLRPRRHNFFSIHGSHYQSHTGCVEDRTMYVFQAMTCSHLARPCGSAPTEKGLLLTYFFWQCRKYTIHCRVTDIHSCFYHRLTSSSVPSTGYSISSSSC